MGVQEPFIRSPAGEAQVPRQAVRLLSGLALGLIAGLLLPRSAFFFFQGLFTASIGQVGKVILCLAVGVACLWAAERLTRFWRFGFSAVALLLGLEYLRQATRFHSMGEQGLIFDDRWLHGAVSSSYAAALVAFALAAAPFLVGSALLLDGLRKRLVQR